MYSYLQQGACCSSTLQSTRTRYNCFNIKKRHDIELELEKDKCGKNTCLCVCVGGGGGWKSGSETLENETWKSISYRMERMVGLDNCGSFNWFGTTRYRYLSRG